MIEEIENEIVQEQTDNEIAPQHAEDFGIVAEENLEGGV